MKKRILSLFLALVTVFYILPIGSIPAIALDETEEESYLTIEDLEVGKLYSAEFVAEEFYPYALSRYASVIDDGLPALSKDVLEGVALTVVRKSYEDVGVVYIAGEDVDWLGDYSEYRYLYSADLIIVDSEDNSVLWNEMELNKEYSATLWEERDEVELLRPMDASETPKFLEYFYVDVYSEGFLSTTGFPKELIVELINDTDTYVHVVNEDWPEKYNLFRYVEPEFDINVLGEYTPSDDGYIYGKVDIFCEGAVDNVLRLERGKKVQAFTELSSGISANARFQWEMEIEDGRWAIIPDSFMSYINVSEALIANTTGEYATLRCIVTDGTQKYASEELKVQIKPDTNVYYGGANGAQQFAGGLSNQPATAADGEFFQANINYKFVHTTREDIHDQDAAVPFIHTFYTASDTLSATIYSPFVMGYTACILDDENGTIKYGEHSYTAKPLHHFENVNSESPEKDRKLTIYYVPNVVNFTVEYYEQNLADDAYTRAGQVRKEGYTDDYIGDKLAEKRTGFKALFYDKEMTIAGNEGTVVEIYYDRIYYLVDFELQGGYGITPYYVKHGTQVMLTEPTKPGYSFDDPWILTRVYSVTEDELGNKTEENITITNELKSAYANKNAGASITVKNNIDYQANWVEATTKYSIVYWLEDANSSYDKNTATIEEQKGYYNVWYVVPIESTTGATTVNDAKDIKKYIARLSNTASNDVNNHFPYIDYNDDLSDKGSKTVSNDGTTVLNVYFTRKEYTLKFYYAMSTGTGTNQKWYVIGGSTYYATNYDTGSADTSNILEMLERYTTYSNATKQLGECSAPTLNAKGTARNYTTDSEKYKTTSNYTHHFISFTAKYGADISELWPCDVFNSVTNKEKNTSNPNNGFKGDQAKVSAWNGERRVKYTQDNLGNQTIKGNYTQLDANLLWKDTTITDTTVSYICFWENGAEDIGWNYPKLYRYKIWLPTLEGVDYSDKITVTRGGVTYYLADTYDTCDDAMMGGQTNPAIVGFTHIERTGYHVASAGSSYATQPNSRLTDANDAYVGDINSTAGQEEINEIKALVEGNNPTYTAAAIVDHFYERQEFVLTYNDGYNNTDPKRIPYGTLLNVEEYTLPSGPAYPSTLEVGQRVFTGWYMDEGHTIPVPFDTTLSTMPAANIQIYAGWITSKHTVQVYRQKSEIGSTTTGQLLYDAKVPFNTQVREEDLAKYVMPQENYVFSGWYYEVDGVEKRYDFNTMLIKGETIIYAKWTKNIQIPYTIKYVLRGDGGEIIEIAKQESGFSLAGIQKTFTAKMGSELYDEYDEWYFPQKRYITHIMSENLNENEVFFEYKTSQIIEYSIVHIFQSEKLKTQYGKYFPDGTFVMEIPHKIEMGKDEFETAIIERYNDEVNDTSLKTALEAKFLEITNTEKNGICKIIAALTADYYIQEMVLTLDPSNNVMVFNWFESEQTKTYHVVHYLQDRVISGKDPTYSVYSSVNHTVQNDNAYLIVEEWDNPYGFERKEVKIGGVAKKEYLDDAQVEVTLGELGNNLVIEFYYNRALLNYTIHHYVNGTSQRIINDEYGKAYYEDEIQVSDIDYVFDGYVIANSGTVKQITTDGDEIICFYDPMTVYYRFQEAISGRGNISKPTYEGHVGEIPDQEEATIVATARAGFRFIGWYLDVAGTQPVDQYAVITGVDGSSITPKTPTADMANKTIIFYALFEPTTRVFRNQGVADDNQSFIYRIRGRDAGNLNVDVTFVITGNGSVTLAMLPYGNYEITVLSWAWRYPLPNGQVESTWVEDIDSPDEYVFYYNTATAGPNNQWLSDDTQGGMAPTADSVS